MWMVLLDEYEDTSLLLDFRKLVEFEICLSPFMLTMESRSVHKF